MKKLIKNNTVSTEMQFGNMELTNLNGGIICIAVFTISFIHV